MGVLEEILKLGTRGGNYWNWQRKRKLRLSIENSWKRYKEEIIKLIIN